MAEVKPLADVLATLEEEPLSPALIVQPIPEALEMVPGSADTSPLTPTTIKPITQVLSEHSGLIQETLLSSSLDSDAAWADTFGTLDESLAGGILYSVGGFLKSIGENPIGSYLDSAPLPVQVVYKPMQKLSNYMRGKELESAPFKLDFLVEKADTIIAAAKETLKEVPENQTVAQKSVSGAVQSLGTILPALLLARLSKRAGARALIAGTGAALPTFGQTYATARETLSPEESRQAATVDAVAEAALGSLSLTRLFSKTSAPLLKRFTGFLLAELPTELATTIAQDTNAKLSYNPDMTWGQFLEDMQVTALSTLIQAPIMTSAVRSMEALDNRKINKKYIKERTALSEEQLEARASFAVPLNEKGDFALVGSEKLGDKNLLNENYIDLSNAKILNPNNAEVRKDFLDRVLLTAPESKKRAINKLRREATAPLTEALWKDLGLQPIAETLGYDGAIFSDLKDLLGSNGTLWNPGAASKLSKAEGFARIESFLPSDTIEGSFTALPESLLSIWELQKNAQATLDAAESSQNVGSFVSASELPWAGFSVLPRTGRARATSIRPLDSTIAGSFPHLVSEKTGIDPSQTSVETLYTKRGGKWVESSFNTLEQGDRVLVISESSDREERPFLWDKAGNFTEQFIKKLMPEARVVIAQNLARPATESGKATAVDVPNPHIWKTSDGGYVIQLGRSSDTESFLHELGHAFFDYSWSRASIETQGKIIKQYLDWVNKTVNGTIGDWLKYKGALPEAADYALDKETDFLSFYNRLSNTYGLGSAEYLISFHEFLAQQSTRIFTANPTVKELATPEFWGEIQSLGEKMVGAFGLDSKSEVLDAFFGNNMAESIIKDITVKLKAKPPKPIKYVPFEERLKRITSFNKLIPPELKKDITASLTEGYDIYNKLVKYGATLVQLERLNGHIKPLLDYTGQVREWHTDITTKMVKANDILEQWNGLGKGQADALAKFIDEWSHLDKRPNGMELVKLTQKYKIQPEAFQVFVNVDEAFQEVLQEIQDVLVRDAESKVSDYVVRAEVIDNIVKEFQAMREKPYFPRKRFGQYAISLRATKDTRFEGVTYREGDLVRFETVETEKEQKSRVKELRKKYGTNNSVTLSTGFIAKDFQGFAGMPPQLADSVAEKLQLTQEQRKDLQKLLAETGPAQSFKKHFNEKDDIAGYSENAMRTFATYFWQASRHLGRVKYYSPMQDAMNSLSRSAARISAVGGDATKRGQILEHVRQHYDYIMNPPNEWASLRGFGFLVHLGFNVKSAMLNALQVPMAAYPYLAARFSDEGAAKALVKASSDIARRFLKGNRLSEDDVAYMEAARKAGFQDESNAATLAGMTEGENIYRLLPISKGSRFVRGAYYYGAFLFHQVEKFSRATTGLATFRLVKEEGATFEAAFTSARSAVEATMFEYATWNRPLFMREKRSVLFLFYQFVQNSLFLAYGGYGKSTAARYMAILVLLAGLEGLPFAENAGDIASFIWTKIAGQKKDIWLEARELLLSLNADPDLVLHGLSQNSFGIPYITEAMNVRFPQFDMSRSLGLGRILPATDAIFATEGDFTRRFQMAAESIAGAAYSIPLSWMKVATSNDPDTWKRLERGFPTAARSISRAIRLGREGQESGSLGEEITPFNWTDPIHRVELVGQALGFTPTRLSRAYEKNSALIEAQVYWSMRRSLVLDNYYLAFNKKDREAMADARQSLKQYNKDVPFAAMKIGVANIASSIKSRTILQIKRERDIAPQRYMQREFNAISDLFPEENNLVPVSTEEVHD